MESGRDFEQLASEGNAMNKLLISELMAGSTLLIAMLVVYASPQYHPFVKAVLLPRLAYGGISVMVLIAFCAFVVSGG